MTGDEQPIALGYGWSDEALDGFRRWAAQMGWPADVQDSWLRSAAAHGWTAQEMVAEIRKGLDAQPHVVPPQDAAPHHVPPAQQQQAPKKSRKRTLAWVFGGIGAAVAAVVVVAVAMSGASLMGELLHVGAVRIDASKAGPGAEDREFANVFVGVDRDQEFLFDVGFPVGEDDDLGEIVEVYLDPQLTMPAPDVSSYEFRGQLSVSPSSFSIGKIAEDGDGYELQINQNGEWGLFDRYYLAVKKDLATGEVLPEPVVSLFTPKAELDSPVATYEARDGGDGVFRWNAVEGATRYVLVSLGYGAHEQEYGTSSRVEVLATTDGTQIAASDVPTEDWMGRNSAFVSYVGNSEDEARDPDYADRGPYSARTALYGVVAMTADDVPSAVALVNQRDVSAGLPVKVAGYALREVMVGRTRDVADLPDQVPVTMADGSTTVGSVEYAVGSVTERFGGYETTFSVLGSTVVDTVAFTAASVEAAQAALAEINARSLALRANTGGMSLYSYVTPDLVGGGETSSTLPDVPYPVFATTDLGRFIATNFVAGNFKVSLADFFEPGSRVSGTGVDIDDVIGEVVTQNPYLLGLWNVSYSQSTRVLYGQPVAFTDLDTYRADQAALKVQVEDVVARIGTKPSQADTVRAINDWLVGNADYHHTAWAQVEAQNSTAGFERAWSAEGVLLDGAGVCVSYSVAFQALALEAGIEAVNVTGRSRADGVGHEWSRAKVDGAWLNLDVTWNDGASADRWLLVTDAELDADHVVDTDWLVDSQLAAYTTG